MTLISNLNNADGSILRTYKNCKTGYIVHTLLYEIGGKGIGVKTIHCDSRENPYKIIDAAKNRYDVYEKTKDGSTVLKSNGKVTSFPNLIFNTVCERIFGK